MITKSDWRSRSGRYVALALAASLALTACGSHASSKQPAASNGPAADAGSTSSAIGSPINIGFVNDEGTSVSFPEYRYGAEAAVKYINSTGGINGHPINLNECTGDGTPTASVHCANSFVDKHVVAEFAGFDAGADSALPVLDSADIPFVTENAWGPKESTDSNSFLLLPAGSAVEAAAVLELSKLGQSHVGRVIYAIPEQQQATPRYRDEAQKLGMTLEAISTPASSPDFVTAANTAIANHDDSLIAFLTESACTNFVKSVRTAGFAGPLVVGSCADYVKALGAQAANTYAIYQTYSPQVSKNAPADVKQQIAVYTKAMTAAGHADIINGLARNAFSGFMDFAAVLATVQGSFTAQSVKSALAHAKVSGFMGPDVDCASHPWKEEPQACSAEVIIVKASSGPDGVQLSTSGSYLDVASVNG